MHTVEGIPLPYAYLFFLFRLNVFRVYKIPSLTTLHSGVVTSFCNHISYTRS